ncbi:MFS transporter [Sciscionella sediminilitoris]|uniref:MFS transporter n=1 Tax=Sciscionella sediminilitoris TaxID=1445613 RepID=UPI0004DFBE0A|nr:MFS transporter [Sciscionella sp. SE31]
MRTGEQVVADLPWRWRVQGKIFLLGGLGFGFDAWDVSLTGYLLPLLERQWRLGATELGLFATAGFAGMAIGAFGWGSLADGIGRKRAFSLTLLGFALCSGLGALAPNYPILLVTRFLAGLALGGCVPVDYAMVAEFTPRAVRGRVLTALNLWWPIGASLCGLVSSALVTVVSWRVLLALMVVPALLVFFVRRGVPESPLFLAHKGRAREASTVIEGLVRATGANPGPWRVAPNPGRATESVRDLLARFTAIWRFDWKLTLAAWLLFVAVLLEYYGTITWLPSLLSRNGAGTVAAFLGATAMTAVGIAGTALSAWLVDVLGRKPVILVSGALAAFALVGFAVAFTAEGPALPWLIGFGFAIEFTIPAMQCYVPELYPTSLRGTGFGWASAASRVTAAVVPLVFGSLLWPVLGLTVTFIVTGAFVLLALGWLACFGPETRGRVLDERETGGKRATAVHF